MGVLGLMANLMICSTELGDTATYSGGGWTTGLPLENVKGPDQYIVARSTDAQATNTRFTATLDRARPVQVLGIGYHNLTSTATIHITGTSGGTQTIDGTYAAYDAVYRTQDLDWEDPNFWFGTPSDEDLENIPRNFFAVLPQRAFADTITFQINDPQHPDNYVQFGRPLISNPFIPTINMAYGAQETLSDLTTVQRTLAGSRRFDRRRVLRGTQFELADHPEYDLRMGAQEIMRRRGLSGQVFFIPDPTDLRTRYLKSFFGNFETLSPVTRAFFEHANLAVNILEI